MPTFINWLLRLLPTNPICMRLVQGGSRQLKHLYIRSGYLAITIVVLMFALLGGGGVGTLSLRELAGAGANMFQNISYLQVALICLLTPIFMAGAIAQEANPRTWEILLTTPLNNLQVVLGNLFGRLFFVIALLFSSLPLFVMTQYFGGVPGESIFASYLIAGSSALLVAAIAVTLSVTRTAGRRAVFLFYFSVILYLFITAGADQFGVKSVPATINARYTSWFTAVNPFLALRVLLTSNVYVPHDFAGQDVFWLKQAWLSRPIATFCWLCVLVSLFLMAFSTLRLRVIGSRTGSNPWYRKIIGLTARGATERPSRNVSNNTIAWRESVARGKTMAAILARWGFVTVGLSIGLFVIMLFHFGQFTAPTLRQIVAVLLAAEVVIIVLTALNMSATAVSKEREDGTLDIILTTPIQPGPYIAGKHRGLVQFLIPMMLVPIGTTALLAIYMLCNGFGRAGGVGIVDVNSKATGNFAELPAILPEGAIALPLLLIPFVAFCVMVGLNWSIRSKGTIGSVIAAVGIVFAVVGVISLCGQVSGQGMSVVGGVLSAFSPINLLFSFIYPAQTIPSALNAGIGAGRTSVMVGAAIGGVAYAAISYAMHTNMKRTFMMTVRRLAGAS